MSRFGWSGRLVLPETAGTPCALILDDEAERRARMRDGLRHCGVRCDEAATLGEALALLGANYYDLVVCDMVLCDPPGGANPSLRGYLAVCFAVARANARWVVQASSVQRWQHRGSILTSWSVEEVADLLHARPGIGMMDAEDGGCPWSALRRCEEVAPPCRADAIGELRGLPMIRELETSTDLAHVLDRLEDAAKCAECWGEALAAAWQALFPGSVPSGI